MSVKSAGLRAVVAERLAAAAEEISAAVERAMAASEEELRRCREENRSKQRLLDKVLSPRVRLYRTVNITADSGLRLKQGPPKIKEEPEEHISSQPHRLRALVTERLTAAAQDIFVPVERTIAEIEEELCRRKEEKQREQQLLEEIQREQLFLEENQRKQLLLEENQRKQLLLEENQREQQLLEENQREQQLLEENQREQQLLGENQREQQLLGENQREQLLPEAVGPHRGAENHHSANPTAEALLMVKQENCDDLQICGAPGLQVKEENPWEVPIMDVVMETDSHINEGDDLTDAEEMENIETWQIALHDETDGDRTGLHLNSEMEDDQECSTVKKKARKGPFCEKCQKRFVSYYALRQHKVIIHANDKPYCCPVCGKGFSEGGYIRTHIKRIHLEPQVKPFGCSVCKMAFRSNNNLKKHMYQHTGRRPYECSLCEESFKRKYELQNHMKKHNGNLATTQKEAGK